MNETPAASTDGLRFYPGYEMPLTVYRRNQFVHLENRFTLLSLKSGSASFSAQDSRFTAVSPSIICFNEKEIFSADFSANADYDCIFFHPSVINSFFDFENIYPPLSNNLSGTHNQDRFYLLPFVERSGDFSGLISLPHTLAIQIEDKTALLKKELSLQDSDSWPCRSRSYLFEILFYSTQAFKYSEKAPQRISGAFTGNDTSSKIVHYLSSAYHEKITISDLCSKFGLNRTTLSKMFLKKTGRTVISYLNSIRISVACIMIRDTALPIEEICYRSGFNDPAHFRKVFTKETGFSPGDYRKKYSMMN